MRAPQKWEEWAAVAGIVTAIGAGVSTVGGAFDGDEPETDEVTVTETDEEFGERVISLFYSGDHASRWALLHPSDQAVASEQEFVDCNTQAGLPNALLSVKFSARGAVPVDRPGYDQSTIPVLEYELKARDPEGVFNDVAAVRVTQVEDNENVWSLWDEDYAAYKGGDCPEALYSPGSQEDEGNSAVPLGTDAGAG